MKKSVKSWREDKRKRGEMGILMKKKKTEGTKIENVEGGTINNLHTYVGGKVIKV